MLGQVCTLYPDAYVCEGVWWPDPDRRGQNMPTVRLVVPSVPPPATPTRGDVRLPMAVRQDEFRRRVMAWAVDAHVVRPSVFLYV
jgi:hypothetical protein